MMPQREPILIPDVAGIAAEFDAQRELVEALGRTGPPDLFEGAALCPGDRV